MLKISKNCSELMAKCLENSKCNKMVGNRTIHGFSVKREKGKFIIEMPFGQNGIGKSFEVPDLHNEYDAGRFYMNFGNYEDATHTYIIQGYISDHTGGYHPTKEMLVDPNNEKTKKSYEENDEGMPLYAAQHLWMLGMDILGTVEQQKLFFFTKGVPKTIKITTCMKNDTHLTIHREYFEKFINAMYFMPNAEDIRRPLENMHEQEIREAKPAPKDLIIVGEKDHIEELPNPLPNIEFFLSGWVPENAANFSILLYHGMKELVEEFGQKVMEIFVTFDGKNIIECKVTSFLSKSLTQSCITNDQEKPVAFTPGEKFWLWIKIHNEKLEISLNCNQRTFEIGLIPYSSENYIKFSGDLDLVINQQQENVNLTTEIKSGDSNLTEKSPALFVQKIDDALNMSKLIMIETKSVIMDTNTNVNDKKIEIKFAETKIQNSTSRIVFEFENCRPKILTQCVGNCMNVTFYDNMENKSPPTFCLDSREKLFNLSSETTFNFVFFCNELNKTANKSDPISGLIEMQAFLNQKKIINVTATKCMADYLQVKGDLEYPINVNLLEFVYKYSAITPTYSYIINEFNNGYISPNRYIILHLLWLGKMDNDDSDNNVIIGLASGRKVILKLELDFEEMMLRVTSNRIEERGGRIAFVKNESEKIALKNSFWLKIERIYVQDNDNIDEISAYDIYQNDAFIMEIKNEKELNPRGFINEYNINGNIALFNNPYVFPYQFPFKKNIIEKMAKNETVTITMKWRIMENAEFVEFFVAEGSNIVKIGTKFKNSRKFGVYLHIWADKDVKNGKICISTNFIEKKNCPQEDEISIALLNPNGFKLDNLHELKITFDNEYATIQFDNNDPIEKQGKNFLDAKEFVINGDITIIEPPKLNLLKKQQKMYPQAPQ